MDTQAILLGLTALSRAGAKSSPYLGHFGSAMLAAYFMCDELDLPPETKEAIGSATRHIIAREQDLFRESAPDEQHAPELIENLLSRLSEYAGRLSRSGHTTIIGMFALKAFRAQPNLITPRRVQGILELFDTYQREREEPRYYGSPLGYRDVQLDNRDAIPKYKSALEALAFAIREAAVIYPDVVIGDLTYYFMGEKLHAITHAHAIYELDCMGHQNIAVRALEALRLQVKLNRMSPSPELATPIESLPSVSPQTPEFWQRAPTFKTDLALPHAFKRAYGLLTAVREGVVGVSDPTLTKLWYILQL